MPNPAKKLNKKEKEALPGVQEGREAKDRRWDLEREQKSDGSTRVSALRKRLGDMSIVSPDEEKMIATELDRQTRSVPGLSKTCESLETRLKEAVDAGDWKVANDIGRLIAFMGAELDKRTGLNKRRFEQELTLKAVVAAQAKAAEREFIATDIGKFDIDV
jgi:hypothetical protein